MENNATDVSVLRAALGAKIRQFFDTRGVLEVTTACLTPDAAMDANINAFALNADTWLRTSPEYEMKRLLANMRRDIYQLGPVFRNDPASRLHHREFSMLEWYRLDMGHHQLMDETEYLLRSLTALFAPDSNPFAAFVRVTWRDLLATLVTPGMDVAMSSDAALAEQCKKHNWHNCDSRHAALDFLTDCAARQLDHSQCVFVYDYPEEMAQLAVVHSGIAERFEVYADGMELINGCSELTDMRECHRRYALEQQRQDKQRSPSSAPSVLFEALSLGLPRCAGAALGIDRLLMRLLGRRSIDEVI